MPYFCHTHNGLYEPGEAEGCQHMKCVEYRALDVPPVGAVMGVVPGGAADTASHQYHRNFDKGLDRYAQARKNGMQPKSTTVSAVDEAEAQVASQERALKKLGSVGEELKVAPGVERV